MSASPRPRVLCTLSGAKARRLLDGSDDGPSPLPQLLAAATAPATAAELQGEEAACAAFRSSVHATAVPLGGPRKTRAKTAATIMAAKIIAAVAVTASGAGGVAVATNSYSAHLPQNPVVSGTDTATVRDVSPSGTTTSTTVPSREAPDGDSSTNGDEDADDGAVPPLNPAGRCAAPCTTGATDGAVTSSGQPDLLTVDPQAGNGNKSGEKNMGNGNNSATETKTNNGKKPDQGAKSNNGNGSDKVKSNNGKKPDKGDSKVTANPGQSKKDSNNAQNGSHSKQTGAAKGSAKKNAETTPAA